MRIRPTALHVVAGTTLEESLVLTDEGAPVDLTNATVRLEVAPAPGRTPALAYQETPYVVVGSPAAGEVTINIPPEETRLFQGRDERWEWRLIAIWPGGARNPIAGGPLMVSQELVPAS